MAIQKLVSIRNFAHQDSEPCCVLDGLYLGIDSFPCRYCYPGNFTASVCASGVVVRAGSKQK